MIAATAVRGRVISFGTSTGAEVTFNLQQLYRKMISLLGYAGLQLRRDEQRPGVERALRALADGSIKVLIGRRSFVAPPASPRDDSGFVNERRRRSAN